MTIDVVCLVLMDVSDCILATQRPSGKAMAGMWEFPGGKIEVGETAEQAIRREILEELSMKLGDLERLPSVDHSYDFGLVRLIPFLSHCQERPQFRLNEHQDFKWIKTSNWKSLDWAAADVPIIQYLLDKA